MARNGKAVQTYRDLDVWQRAMDLVESVYRVTASFPTEERFGLTSQLRRAAVSVPANIAEGNARIHRGDYLRHLSIARGSLAELETELIAAGRLGFVTREQATPTWKLAVSTGQLLNKLIRVLSKSDPGTEGSG
jgi:four helix bundle protein